MLVFSGLSYFTFGWVLFSKIKLFLVWVCLTTFLCFVISFLDFILVFKRINYPVLNWVNSVWVPLVFFSYSCCYFMICVF